ncbi:MAG TPA: glycosyltransferase, partial [Chloroflexota bacterium]|nr:glycosyltransferase [Chloroflexota bacterium]
VTFSLNNYAMSESLDNDTATNRATTFLTALISLPNLHRLQGQPTMSASSRARDLLLSLIAVPGLAVVTLLLLSAQALARIVAPRPAKTGTDAPSAETLSVVVAAGDDGQGMERTLRSVAVAAAAEGWPDHEVIVVGPAKSIDSLKNRETLPDLRLLRSESKELLQNWAAGIEASIGSLVILLVEGAELDEVSLDSLTSEFADGRTFAYAPVWELAGEKAGNVQTGSFRGEVRNGELHFWNASLPEAGRHPSPVLWSSGTGCVLRRDRFLELGGFDPQFGSPDTSFTDLCYRAWKREWPVVQGPDIRVTIHDRQAQLHQQGSPDLNQRDHLIFAWKDLSSPGMLCLTQLALTLRLLSDGVRGQLNLRPIRLALSELPCVLIHRLHRPASPMLSDIAVFDRSSRRSVLQLPVPLDAETGKAIPHNEGSTSALSAILKTDSSPLRMLLVCPQLPYPPSHGAAVRMWNVLKVLAERNRVDVLSFYETHLSKDEVDASVREMERYCGEVRVVPRRPDYRPSLLDRTVHVEQFDCPAMREALREMVERNGYDVIQVDKTEMAQYALPRPAPVQLLIEHIIFYHAYRRQFLTRDRVSLHRLIEYFKLRRFELRACRDFDGIVTMSQVDADFLRSRLPDHRCIVDSPNGVDLSHYRYIHEPAKNHDLLFVGNYDHSPNVDGIRFFLKEIFPVIKAEVPDVGLWIVGPGRYDALPEVAAEPQAVTTGFVDDTWPYMARCSVLVAPILAGSGTRLKILEAMASGIPVVTTAIGIEGIRAKNGVHAMIADDGHGFAQSVVTLLHSREMRETLRSSARQLMEGRYDWRSIGLRLEDSCRQLMRDRGSSPNRSSDIR